MIAVTLKGQDLGELKQKAWNFFQFEKQEQVSGESEGEETSVISTGAIREEVAAKATGKKTTNKKTTRKAATTKTKTTKTSNGAGKASKEDCQKALGQVMETQGTANARMLLARYKVHRLRDLDASHYSAFLQDCSAALGTPAAESSAVEDFLS